MGRAALGAAGLALVLFVVLDELRTTLGVGSRPGPLARLLSVGLWRLARRVNLPHRGPVAAIGGLGPLLLALTLVSWFALLWVGWSMVFLAGAPGLRAAHPPHDAASVAEVFYFVGYSLGTLGNGDFSPTTTGFQLAVVATTISGMVLITLGVTYLTPVVSAVTGERSFASTVLGLGESAAAAAAGLAQAGRPALVGVVDRFVGELSRVAQQHRAYPVLHAFRPRSPQVATPRAVAHLLDTVLLAHAATPPDTRLPEPFLRQALQAVDSYLSACPAAGAEVDGPPPVPRLDPQLRTDQRGVDELFAEHADLRRRALEHCRDNDWSWPDA